MSEQMRRDKYNRTGTGANKTIFSVFAGDTEVQEDVNTGVQETVSTEVKKKKATFEMDAELHRKLRMYAANHDTTMVMIVEKALSEYLKNNTE